jgi:hypothetical protein
MTYPGSGGPGRPGQDPDRSPGGPDPGEGPPDPGYRPPYPRTPLPPVPPAYAPPPPGYGESGYGESGYGESGYGESGYGESGYGESGYGESGYGEPGYGESGYAPPPPGYGTPYGPQPPSHSGRNRAPIIAAIVVLLLVGGGAVTVFALNSDKNSKPLAGSATSFPSSGSSDSSGDIDEADARGVVDQYLRDVNAQDRADAETLICTPLVDTWKATIDATNGDFTVKVTNSMFQTSKPNARGLDLSYSLDVSDITSGRTAVSPVTFTVVNEIGDLKICGEK